MTCIAYMSAFLRGDGMTMDIVWTTIVLLPIHSLRECAIEGKTTQKGLSPLCSFCWCLAKWFVRQTANSAKGLERRPFGDPSVTYRYRIGEVSILPYDKQAEDRQKKCKQTTITTLRGCLFYLDCAIIDRVRLEATAIEKLTMTIAIG